MSYSFDGANDSLDGQFGTTYSQPVSLFAMVKLPAGHPAANQCAFQLNNDTTDSEDMVMLRTGAVANDWNCRADALNLGTAVASKDIGTTNWAPWIGVSTNTDGQDVYIDDQTGHSAINVNCAGMSFISAGETTHSTQDFAGLLAHLAIWRIALSAGNIASLRALALPSTVAASDLIGYWALTSSSGTHANQGIDSGGTLTVNGATFNADNPTMASGVTIPRLKAYYDRLRA